MLFLSKGGSVRPEKVVACGRRSKLATSVDASGNVLLQYPDGEASLQFAIDACVPDETRIYGTKGTVVIHAGAHSPMSFTVTRVLSRAESTSETFDYPLPE